MLNINSSGYCRYTYPKMISWNRSSTNCCKWDGVTCHEITGRVIGLDLSCSRLQGIIHPNSSLFRLSELQKLNLAGNFFYGSQIPGRIGGLTSLTHLNLSDAAFLGVLPSELSHLSKLVLLDLSNNYGLQFEQRNFHLLLHNLSRIEQLSLSSVNISSALPANWSSSLRFLNLEGTGVHGKLPDSVFNLPKIQKLTLSNNVNLSVSLRKLYCSISPSLRELDLSGTNFSGEFSDIVGCFKYITSLSLMGCGLSGFLPESIGNLSQLLYLDLRGNKITGLPYSIFNLTALQQLDLSYNLISGPLPSNVTGIQNLSHLRLPNNQLNGTIPSWLFSLESLQDLDLESNQLSGPLPSNVRGVPNLSSLWLSNNQLNGTIPSWLFSLESLQDLNLESNQLSSPLPSNVTGIQNLSHLRLSNNQLNGTIPSWLFSLESSQVLDLRNNQLQGSIPRSISTPRNLKTVLLSSNNLSGTVSPCLFPNHDNLEVFDISDNKLSWSTEKDVHISLPNLRHLGMSSCELKEFPSFLRRSKDLEILQLSNNKLHGPIPIWLTSMPWDSLVSLNLSHNSLTSLGTLNPPPAWKNLWILDLGCNQFQGLLPSSFCTLKGLEFLDLSNNKFNGKIPECFGDLSSRLYVLNLGKNGLQGSIPITFGKNCHLRSLALNDNSLEGPLPKSLAKCGQLGVLDVSNNKINDTFPLWLKNLKWLQVLILKANRFSGPIETVSTELLLPKLRILDLSYNEFTGVLPARLFKSFNAMMSLESEARDYMITFGFDTFGDMSSWMYASMSLAMKGQQLDYPRIFTKLVVINLSSNKFVGEIPRVIANLKSLVGLNLSHNQISGHIPSELGQLSLLESLDLSWNQIEGEIPLQLASLTFLEYLNLSQNHLVGRIPEGRQLRTFPSSSFGGNLGLCGFPLTNDCRELDPQPTLLQGTYEDEEDSSFMGGFTWKSVLIGYGCGILLGLAVGNLMFFTRKPTRLVRIIEQEVYCWCLLLFGKNKSYKKSKR